MEETMEVIGTEGTTPTTETESVADSAAAQEATETTAGAQETEGGEGTTPPPEEDGASAQAAEDDTGTANAFVLPVRFNHEDRGLSLEEARTYAQKGMRMEGMLDKLQVIAAANGQSVEQAVDHLFDAFERTHRKEILERVGGNEEAADALMEKKRSEWNVAVKTASDAAAQAEKDERSTLEARLAADFAEVKAAFGDTYPEFKDIPQAVINDAIKNKRGLFDALLRYRHTEAGKIEANKKTQEKAVAASAGSQADRPSADPGLDSIDRAFFSALG